MISKLFEGLSKSVYVVNICIIYNGLKVKIAVTRNSTLIAEKNDILNFLGSYFLSISWRNMLKSRSNFPRDSKLKVNKSSKIANHQI